MNGAGIQRVIRDPVWHDHIVASSSFDQMDGVATKLVVDICRAMRVRGHVAGTPDASEITRMSAISLSFVDFLWQGEAN